MSFQPASRSRPVEVEVGFDKIGDVLGEPSEIGPILNKGNERMRVSAKCRRSE